MKIYIYIFHFQQIHVILPSGKRPSLARSTSPTTSPKNGSSPTGPPPPTTANQSAQTRSVRFDRRRPQTLELRRGSSRSFIGGCAEMDSYLM